MTIPKDLSKKRNELRLLWANRYADATLSKDDPRRSQIDLIGKIPFEHGFEAGVLAAFESEHVLALVEALEKIYETAHQEYDGVCTIEFSVVKEALAKWSKRNE